MLLCFFAFLLLVVLLLLMFFVGAVFFTIVYLWCSHDVAVVAILICLVVKRLNKFYITFYEVLYCHFLNSARDTLLATSRQFSNRINIQTSHKELIDQ